MSLQQLIENYYEHDIPTNATNATQVQQWLKDTAFQLVHVSDWIDTCQEHRTLTWDDLSDLDSGISELWDVTKMICEDIDDYKKDANK